MSTKVFDMHTPIQFSRTPDNPDLPLPSRATPGSVGYDLMSGEPDFVLPPLARKVVGTGFRVRLPDGLEGQIRPRSGLSSREGVTVINAPGTVDPDYRGELKVALINLSTKHVKIYRGQRVAQLVLAHAPTPDVVEVSPEQIGNTDRGDGGFGSTGA